VRHEIAADPQTLRRNPAETPPVSGSILLGGWLVIRERHLAMTSDRIDRTGFAPPRSVRARGHRSTAVAQLITSAALMFSIAVTATVVSIGIARADAFPAIADDSHMHVAILLALVLVGMGGLTAWMTFGGTRAKARD
jgi:hypothetical protein